MENENLEKLVEKAREVAKEPDAIADGYDMTFQWISPRMSKLLGYDVSDIVDKQVMVIHSNSSEEARIMETEIFAIEEPMIKDIPIKTKSGKFTKFRLKFFPFEFNGSPYITASLIKVLDG